MAKRRQGKRGEDWKRDPTTLAGRLTLRIEELSLKPTDLARAAGVSVSAVGAWLRGNTKNLKLDNLFKIADALDVEPRWLATGLEPKEPYIKGLSRALPEWRQYVLSLAAMRPEQQALMLQTMRQAVSPPYEVTPAPEKREPAFRWSDQEAPLSSEANHRKERQK